MAISLVGLSGSTRRPSRTSILVRLVLDAVAGRLDIEPQLIELADAAPTVYAIEADFIDGLIVDTAVLQRIERAADEVAGLVAGGLRLCPSPFPRRLVPAGL